MAAVTNPITAGDTASLCPAQVTSRANGQLLEIERLFTSYHLSGPARMELIAAQVDEWRRCVTGSVGWHLAQREAKTNA